MKKRLLLATFFFAYLSPIPNQHYELADTPMAEAFEQNQLTQFKTYRGNATITFNLDTSKLKSDERCWFGTEHQFNAYTDRSLQLTEYTLDLGKQLYELNTDVLRKAGLLQQQTIQGNDSKELVIGLGDLGNITIEGALGLSGYLDGIDNNFVLLVLTKLIPTIEKFCI